MKNMISVNKNIRTFIFNPLSLAKGLELKSIILLFIYDGILLKKFAVFDFKLFSVFIY